MRISQLILLLGISLLSQSQKLSSDTLIKYENSFDVLSVILKNSGSFKESVLLVENTFNNISLSNKNFDEIINTWLTFTKDYYVSNNYNHDYRFDDSTNYFLNLSLFASLFDTLNFNQNPAVQLEPFRYSFIDPLGKQDWSNMFVTKLLATHEGNCHSLAYLYKILADEVGAKCWLSLAPNHIYIKNYSEKIGWYNTELTNGTFPTDAWEMVTGYVNPEAIKSGLYMDTLSNQQSIALCVLDLAKEYEFQTHNYYNGFILKCCDLVLQYHPVNPMALLLKAETLKKVWLKEKEEKFPKPTVTINEMQNAYITLAKLGYREMPEKMYQQWLKEMTTEKEKCTNKKVATTAIKK
ncbi:MAG TPA: hypothetical protein VFW07_12260 [Parafilimonas sp.]|nr:hypothetical protein [Parafilimonas sp.]